jgi:hypothetical protein
MWLFLLVAILLGANLKMINDFSCIAADASGAREAKSIPDASHSRASG